MNMLKTLLKKSNDIKHYLYFMAFVMGLFYSLSWFGIELDRKVNYSDIFGYIITLAVGVYATYYIPKILNRSNSKREYIFNKWIDFYDSFQSFHKNSIMAYYSSIEPIVKLDYKRINYEFKHFRKEFVDLVSLTQVFAPENYINSKIELDNIKLYINGYYRQATGGNDIALGVFSTDTSMLLDDAYRAIKHDIIKVMDGI